MFYTVTGNTCDISEREPETSSHFLFVLLLLHRVTHRTVEGIDTWPVLKSIGLLMYGGQCHKPITHPVQ